MKNTYKINDLANWLPVRLMQIENTQKLVWHYFSNHLFTDPFFDESIAKTKSHFYNSSKYRSTSDLSVLNEWQCYNSLSPKAIIFHTSRCGSTLLSQYLSLSPSNISLSEVPIIDQFLRLAHQFPDYKETTIKQLEYIIKLYGQKRNEVEKNLFIKTDSWHFYFWEVYRNLYPKAPFIILYRHPLEIFISQQKLKGQHAVPGLIVPEIMGFKDENVMNLSFEVYFGKVLNYYYLKILEIADKDKNVLLINYNEGVPALVDKFVGFLKIDKDEKINDLFSERQKFHSKHPEKTFIEERTSHIIPTFLAESFLTYLKIENYKKNSNYIAM